MRRTSLVGTVLLGVALAMSPLTDVADAKERLSLSSLVGRLLKIKKSQPAAEEVEPPAAQPPASEPSPQPRARIPLPAAESERAQAGSTSETLPSPLSASAPGNSQPYPPLPPAINQAWLHPPQHEPDRAYSATEVLALTRSRLDRATSAHGLQTDVTRTSAFGQLGFSPTDSPAFSAPGRLAHPVRQVNHVANLAAPPVQSLPVESLPVESLPVESLPVESLPLESLPLENLPAEQMLVGNTPAEVRTTVPENSFLENAVSAGPVADERVADRTVTDKTVTDETVTDKTVTDKTVTDKTVTDEPVAETSVTIESLGRRTPPLPARTKETTARLQEIAPAASRSLPPVFQKVRGRVAAIDGASGIVRVDLSEQESLPAGSKIRVYHANGAGEPVAVYVQVLDSVPGVAVGKLMDDAPLDSIAPGDKVMAWKAATGQ